MKNEQEIVRSVFDAYIRDAKATSTKKDRPTFDMLEKVKNMAIKVLEQQPSEDCVSLEVYKQVMSERDIAIEQLRELGYDFGEKIRPSEDCVSRQAVDLLCFKYLKPNNDDNVAFYEHFCDLPPVTPTIPKGATNGDMIKAMFPNVEADEIKTDTGGYIEVKYLDTTDKCDATAFRKDWWNAPYKRGDSDGSN